MLRQSFHAEAKIQHMEQPDEPQHDTAHTDASGAHHGKADAHKEGDGDHDTDFGFAGHAAAGDIVFEVFFIQPGIPEPAVQFFGAAGEAEGGQHQEGEGRQHRHYGTHGTQTDAHTAEGDIEIFFHNNSSGFIHNLPSGDGFIQRKAVGFG